MEKEDMKERAHNILRCLRDLKDTDATYMLMMTLSAMLVRMKNMNYEKFDNTFRRMYDDAEATTLLMFGHRDNDDICFIETSEGDGI